MSSAIRVGDVLASMASGLKRFIHPISKYLGYLSAVLSLCMAAVIILDLILRLGFNRPMSGILEYETFLLVVITFLSLAQTMIKRRHVAIDLVSSRFSPAAKSFLGAVFSIFGAFMFSLMSWRLALRTIDAVENGSAASVTEIPLYPFYFIAALGCALITLVLLEDLLNGLCKILKNEKSPWLWFSAILVVSVAVLIFPVLMKLGAIKLGSITTGLLFLILMLVMMMLGFPIAFSMGLTGILGLWYLTGFKISMGALSISVYDSVSEYYLCVVPFFILMGLLCLKAGVSRSLYKASHAWFGQMPGGLAVGTVLGCGGFAAICGDSMATAATMSSVSLPEMKRYHYDDALATGSVAAGGTLGILIPPSIGFIAYGIITEQSVGQLFMAGMIPGLLLMALFAVTVYIRCKRNPNLGPAAGPSTFSEKMASLKDVWQVFLLFCVVIGGIYSGLVTPTEAGGVGAIGALVIASLSREFSWKGLFEALIEGIEMSTMILTILIGVTILGNFITLTQIPMELAGFLDGLNVSRYVLFALILLLYLILGMVMNIIPMIMLTLPILFPTIMTLGFDPIWFGVIMVIMMEMGQITPPVGINVFVIHGVADKVPMSTIFRGVLPFLLVQVLVIVILTLFPQIALYLPNAMDVLAPIGN